MQPFFLSDSESDDSMQDYMQDSTLDVNHVADKYANMSDSESKHFSDHDIEEDADLLDTKPGKHDAVQMVFKQLHNFTSSIFTTYVLKIGHLVHSTILFV